ncbi:phage tail family protein [Staphylococcus equorum]|nr:phage tail family protein [Staphylococcus equorum]
MDLKITRQNGDTFTLGEHGVEVSDVVISGVEMEEQSQNIQGLHGSFDMGATYKGREISVPFSFQGQNMASYPIFRDLIYKLTTSTESYYIQELRRPQVEGYTFKDTKGSNAITVDEYGRETVFDTPQSNNDVNTGKRYLVRLSGATEIEQSKHNAKGKGELTFHTTELPFAESVGTSLDLEREGLTYNENSVWAYGMGLIRNPETRQYTFDLSRAGVFDVYNFGDVPIDQLNQYLKISVTFNEDISGYFKFGFNDIGAKIDSRIAPLRAGDELTYENGAYFRNGENITHATNYYEPELNVGLNKLKLNKLYNAELKVDCRYYYL